MALVQLSAIKQADGVSTSSTFSAASNFTAGNSVIVPIVHYAGGGGGITGVTIGGMTATQDKVATADPTAMTYIYRVHNFSGSGANVVVTYGGGSDNYTTCAILEWSGLANAAPDASGAATGNSTAPSVTTSGSTTASTNVTIGVATISNGVMGSITTGSSQTDIFKELDGNTHQGGAAGYRVETTTSTKTSSWTSSTSSLWSACNVSYKLASGATNYNQNASVSHVSTVTKIRSVRVSKAVASVNTVTKQRQVGLIRALAHVSTVTKSISKVYLVAKSIAHTSGVTLRRQIGKNFVVACNHVVTLAKSIRLTKGISHVSTVTTIAGYVQQKAFSLAHIATSVLTGKLYIPAGSGPSVVSVLWQKLRLGLGFN